MARGAISARLSCWKVALLGAVLMAILPLPAAELRIPLDQLGQRKLPDYSAVYEGQIVVVRGVVSMPSVSVTDYNVLAIEAGSGGGLIKVPAKDRSLDPYHPGDEVEITGKVVMQYGLPMV